MTATQREKRILFRLQVPARDGIKLCTDVYLPRDVGARPTVLVRTPYGRNMQLLMRLAKSLNRIGCGVALQDCRGSYQSEGLFDIEREHDDTHDTLGWLAQQDWANGRVGLYGASIAAQACFVTAASEPPSGIEIAAIGSVMGSVSHHAVVYRGGALLLHWALPWALMMDRSQMGTKAWSNLPWQEVFRHLPLVATPEKYSVRSAFWSRLLERPERSRWTSMDARPLLENFAVPVLHIAGWRDFMFGESFAAYRALQAGGSAQKLIVGPWDHRTVFASFFNKASDDAAQFALVELIALWFHRWLADGESPSRDEVLAAGGDDTRAAADFLAGEAGTLLYAQQDGGWLRAPVFPLEDGAETATWYLRSGGAANTAHGDGELSLERSDQLGRDTFRYDPEDPVPTTGGSVWPLPHADIMPGPSDQSEVEARHDVLVYTGPKLAEDLFLAGPIEVELWASTSARDTDFTAKLVDVDLFGVPTIVQDAIIRGRFHRSADHAEPLEARRPYRFTISLLALVRRWKRGHRLRLEISSSNFPKYDRHPNSAGPLHTAKSGMVAEQTVFHGGQMASCLRLTTISKQRFAALRVAPQAG